MKKFLMMLVALFGMFIMTGCGDSPMDVVEAWGDAIIAGDKEAADEYVTDDSKPWNAMLILAAAADEEKAQESFDELIADGEVVINGNKAEIKLNGSVKYTLVKVDGEWKIALVGGADADDADDEDEE